MYTADLALSQMVWFNSAVKDVLVSLNNTVASLFNNGNSNTVIQIEQSGLEPWPEHCIVFLSKTLYSHSASLHPGVQMGTGEFNAGGNAAMD